jgi:glycerophosphoryl diester phosphodiesterase
MIKLFAHRGLVENNMKQNSIASLKNAVAKGFKAVEFDIWWLDGEFFIKHDKPNEKEKFLLPRLQDYLCFGNDLEYWFDFKNLDQNNIDEALKKLNVDLILKKVDLAKIFFAPYLTDYKLTSIISSKFRKFFSQKINFVGVCDNKNWRQEVINMIDLELIDFISINHSLIDNDFLKKISPAKLLVWTVNDIKIINDLYLLGIDKFATDKALI